MPSGRRKMEQSMDASFVKIKGRERIYPVTRINHDNQEVVLDTDWGDLTLPFGGVDFLSAADLPGLSARDLTE